MHDVTIIIPVYCTTEESLKWLGECLESACSQDCQVIAVDDGSLQDIHSTIRQFKRCNYYHDSHHGVSSARNQAVMAATTRLIIPLDCDDRFVSGAIGKLLSKWDGTPLYPDVRKFGLENIDHYRLLDFDCEHIYTHVGFSSVNVLHSKDQWRIIGGWDENIDFFEDGEYNARLFGNFCGVRYPEPLVEYRIHDNQRTKKYKPKSAYYAKTIMSRIRRMNMPCSSCGKKKSRMTVKSTSPIVVAEQKSSIALPGEVDGRILAQYVGGKGQGKHYYRGIRTNFAYKVMHDDFVYVDPSDLRTDPNDKSLFVRVAKTEQATQEVITVTVSVPVLKEPSAVVAAIEEPIHLRTSVKSVDKRVAQVEDTPDISTMSFREIQGLDYLDSDLASKLLKLEQNGKNRSKVTNFLKGYIHE